MVWNVFPKTAYKSMLYDVYVRVCRTRGRDTVVVLLCVWVSVSSAGHQASLQMFTVRTGLDLSWVLSVESCVTSCHILKHFSLSTVLHSHYSKSHHSPWTSGWLPPSTNTPRRSGRRTNASVWWGLLIKRQPRASKYFSPYFLEIEPDLFSVTQTL